MIAIPLSTTAGDSAEDKAVVRVLPAEGSYRAGQEIAVEVWVEDVANLYGANVHLVFDTTRLRVLDANPSLPGVQVMPRDDLLSSDLVIHREADNEAGTIWYAVTQLNPSEPVSGSGALFSFNFQTLATGLGLVNIQQHTLATRDGDVIPADAEGACYLISGRQTVLLPLIVVNR